MTDCLKDKYLEQLQIMENMEHPSCSLLQCTLTRHAECNAETSIMLVFTGNKFVANVVS